MHSFRIDQTDVRSRCASPKQEPASVAERELLIFIDAVLELIGPESQRILSEIWLDELACMDRIPEPSSPDWRWVTLAASRRLAMRLIDIPFSRPCVHR
jgi:hypothetical protein